MEGDLQVFYRGAKRLYTHQKGPLFESMSITVFFFFCGGFRNSEHAVCLIQLPNYKIRIRKKNVDFFFFNLHNNNTWCGRCLLRDKRGMRALWSLCFCFFNYHIHTVYKNMQVKKITHDIVVFVSYNTTYAHRLM